MRSPWYGFRLDLGPSLYDATATIALCITIPAGLTAAQIGIYVFKRLTDAAFRRLLILLNLAMGLGILISEIW